MSNYTDAELNGIADFTAGVVNKTADLIENADRIKQEHAELVEALTWIVDQVDRFGGITIENNHSTFEKFRAILEKVKCK